MRIGATTHKATGIREEHEYVVNSRVRLLDIDNEVGDAPYDGSMANRPNSGSANIRDPNPGVAVAPDSNDLTRRQR